MKNKIKELLKDYNISKSLTSPAPEHLMKHRELTPLSAEYQKDLRSGVARLLFLSIHTRPDIAVAVNYLCTRIEKFDDDDLKKFHRILGYLHGTQDRGLTLICKSQCPTIHVYVDAAYGIRSIDRLSQTGVCVMLDNALIVARSAKQKLVTKSSTESELVACSDSLVYGLIIRNILDELKVNHNEITLHQDNEATIKLIRDPKSASIRTKHISIRYFFIRDIIKRESINLIDTPTSEMIADILTKPLQGKLFLNLRSRLMDGSY
jgi:hypothetical protein